MHIVPEGEGAIAREIIHCEAVVLLYVQKYCCKLDTARVTRTDDETYFHSCAIVYYL